MGLSGNIDHHLESLLSLGWIASHAAVWARGGAGRKFGITPSGEARLRRLEAEGLLPEIRTDDGEHGAPFDPRATDATPVNRDPCPFCEVRGDIGCRHRAAGDPAPRLSLRGR
jgi:hypothetical protein